ncbi:MAG TPA: CHAT domain-containing protein, partial [Acidimicrobiales bacterium]|nr:CHAT domain-containing protein [Acidimicrobiales bacterium]
MATAAELAAEAVRLAQDLPDEARALVDAAMRADPDRADHSVAALCQQALGMAARIQGRMAEAVTHLEEATRLADAAELRELAAKVRVSLASAYAYQGNTAASLAALDQAEPWLQGADQALVDFQRAFLLSRQGRADEALPLYERALRVFRRIGDRLRQARVLNNRGLLLLERGLIRQADRDLARAERLFEDLDIPASAATTSMNRGLAAAKSGDLPTALALYDRAADRLSGVGLQLGQLRHGRCEALLSAGLVLEARTLSRALVGELRDNGVGVDLAEALLMESHAALLVGDADEARVAADEALDLFVRQHRPGWIGLARHAVVRAAWGAGSRGAGTFAAAQQAARELEDVGLAAPAVDARIIAARIALEGGRVDEARAELAGVAGGRRAGTADLRARAWHADALLRLADGDRRGADAALRAGLRVVERQRASLGASELRSHLSIHIEESACLGLRLAISAGHPGPVLAWMERLRGNALHYRPVRPPDDGVLADELTELRSVVAELEGAAMSGRPTAPIVRHQVQLEEAIRRRVLRRRGDGQGPPAAPRPRLAELHHALGNRALVELAVLDDTLHGVVLAAGVARVVPLAPIDVIDSHFAQILFALRRIANQREATAGRAAATASLRSSALEIDRLLLGPLGAFLGERALVIAPTGALHAFPWSILPSCRGRPVTVVPSASIWYRSATAVHPGGGPGTAVHPGGGGADPSSTLLVAGPGLANAASEVGALAQLYPGATRLTGRRATVAAVLKRLNGAPLVHLAAHGSFRADNPLFSSLALADGPLTVYDLERLDRAPDVIVLSACQSGLSAVRPGDELMGLAAVLFSLGTRTLVASVIPVPDAATERL